MYVQHPYKFEGKYYAQIDRVFYEISKEVAMAMFADYRNEIYRSRKRAPDFSTDEVQIEELQDLKSGQAEAAEKKKKKCQRKNKLSEILDCAFSESSDGLSVDDMSDETQPALDEMMIMKEESRILHKNIRKLTDEEQFIIRSIYFDGMKQKDVAKILNIVCETQKISHDYQFKGKEIPSRNIKELEQMSGSFSFGFRLKINHEQ